MAFSQTNLRECYGKVINIKPPYKAIVQFELDNKPQRALLKYQRLTVNGQALREGGSITEYLEIGTELNFLCHNFDKSKSDRCGWFITSGWIYEAKEGILNGIATVLNGLNNCNGQVSKIARRQGVLTCVVNGLEEYVLFLGSKLFMFGNKVSSKAILNQLQWLEKGRTLFFDAVPCDPSANDSSCKWFATAVWKGRKPTMEYDDVRNLLNKKTADLDQLMEIKQITSNPHSLFLRTEGQVMKIVNEEYGIALAAIKRNHWETVLFHRTQTTLFDRNLDTDDLRNIFIEGDKLRIVAAAAPKKMVTRWVASEVHVLVHPSISHRFQFPQEHV